MCDFWLSVMFLTGRYKGNSMIAHVRLKMVRPERFERWPAPFQDSEGGLEKWLELNAQYARVWPNITSKGEVPPDANRWSGAIRKLEFFIPLPGKGI